jgi:hypothetical protein
MDWIGWTFRSYRSIWRIESDSETRTDNSSKWKGNFKIRFKEMAGLCDITNRRMSVADYQAFIKVMTFRLCWSIIFRDWLELYLILKDVSAARLVCWCDLNLTVLFGSLCIWCEIGGSIGAPIILGRCPSLSAHKCESMLRTYLVCREKQANDTWKKHTVYYYLNVWAVTESK